MIKYEDIRSVHLEISTRCNAACPDCPRNFRGVDIFADVTYPVLDMKLDQARKIFPVEFVQQLDNILINGNYGDFVTASDGLKIVEYFKESNPNINIEISTNASARPKIWTRLGELGVTVDFRLDGLKDTHYLYRQNTDWDLIIDNAKKFIAAGGKAVWAMIKFKHNEHQIAACEQLSRELGFSKFWLVDNGRDSFPVFTPDRKLSHVIGDYTGPTDFAEVSLVYQAQRMHADSVIDQAVDKPVIDCYAKRNNEIYVAANGEVHPCCWIGYYPRMGAVSARLSNHQVQWIMRQNNALWHTMQECIAWFADIEETWSRPVSISGKIYACNETCGINK